MPFRLSSFSHLERCAPRQTRWVRALAAISTGNLCYLRLWDALLHNPEREYLAATPLRPMDYLAAVIGATLLAAVAYIVIAIMWHATTRGVRAAAMAAMLVLFALPLDFVRRSAGWGDMGLSIAPGRYVFVFAVAFLFIVLATCFRQRFFSVLLWVLALLSPYAAVNVTTASLRAFEAPGLAPAQPLASALVDRAPVQHRVVWVIFDEWDQAALFEHRPVGLVLPNLDALVKQSVVATCAMPPSGRTMISLPALLTGVLLEDAKGTGSADLGVRVFGADKWEPFQSFDNVVSKAVRTGRNVTVLGWYHPYRRLLPQSVSVTVRDWGYPQYQGYRRESLDQCVAAQLQYLGSPIFGRQALEALYVGLHSAAVEAVGHENTSLLFLHYGIPHLPGIYSRDKRELSTAIVSSVDGYFSNLALVDRTLGELLAAIDRAGLRKITSVILTSDHWWRSAPWLATTPSYRVPLIIRAQDGGMPGKIDTPLCTTSLVDLVDRLLDGRISTNAEVAQWMGQPHGPVPTGYLKGTPRWQAAENKKLRP